MPCAGRRCWTRSAAIEEGEQIKAAVAADVVRTLVVADLIEEAAVEEALEALMAAEVIEQTALEAAQHKAALPVGEPE